MFSSHVMAALEAAIQDGKANYCVSPLNGEVVAGLGERGRASGSTDSDQC